MNICFCGNILENEGVSYVTLSDIFILSTCILSMVIGQTFLKRSKAIDTDQLVALTVAKVTINTDRWKIHNRNVC